MIGVRRAPGLATRVVIGKGDDAVDGGWRWLSPALVGLTAPILAALIFFPAVLRDAASIIIVVLLFAMFLAVAAYVTTVFVKGPVVGLVVDSARGLVSLVQDGPFATTVPNCRSTRLPISGVAIATTTTAMAMRWWNSCSGTARSSNSSST